MKNILSLFLPFVFTVCMSSIVVAQDDDLLSLLGEDNETDYATASFKTNRIINLHSLENTHGGVLDFKISHRFGRLNQGLYDIFGLDQASIRLGLDYGVTDRFQIGLGRSSYRKMIDGYLKYRILRQSTGAVNMPISLTAVCGMFVDTQKWADPDRENYFTSRLGYSWQLLIGRKFNDWITVQLTPTLIHRNLVATAAEKNDVYALGFGIRQRITRRITFNAEYVYVFPNQLAPQFTDMLSIGFDIETGGHVFQLHFTNANWMNELTFITETTGKWDRQGRIHFGFNISRVFTIVPPKV